MDESKYVSVRLTRKQLEKLVDVLDDTQDEGPHGHGWASPELSELRYLFGSELESLLKAQRLNSPDRPACRLGPVE